MNKAIDALTQRLESRDRKIRSAQRRAAVLVPLVTRAQGFELILTRRTDTLSTHRGQVAFPGGGHDDTDENLVATALREAEEEIGLEPSLVHVLGMLDDIPTVTGETIVTPVVGVLNRMPALVPNPAEVARIFSIPLSALSVSEDWRIERTVHKGRRYPLYFFEHSGETLWGLSAYVTRQLLRCMDRLND